MPVYKYRLVDGLWFSIKTGNTNGRNGFIFQDFGFKHAVNLLIEDFIMFWSWSYNCFLELWELDMEKDDGGLALIRR